MPEERVMEGTRKEMLDISKALSEGKTKNVEEIVKDRLGVDLSASYMGLELRNPLIVAPGPLSQSPFQIKRAAKSGFGGMVLKSVIGENKEGNASMKSLRTRPTYTKWVEDEEENPVFHWNGGLDQRCFKDYLKFAKSAFQLGKELDFPLIVSFLCHLPKERDEEWKFEEWEYTVKKLYEAASIMYEDSPIIFEIDFCPFLKREHLAVDKEIVKRWYREAPRLIKEISPDIKVAPKILNLDFGLKFQAEMVTASKEGGADGVVIANRFYIKYMDTKTKEKYFTTHGGKALRERNQHLIKETKETPDLMISATGGIYSGKHAYEYISLGAQNVQLLTLIMKYGFEESLRSLLFNPKDGFIISILESG